MGSRFRCALLLAPLACALFGCESGRVEPGGPCANSFDCVDEATCFSTPSGEGLCMAFCDPGTRLCAGGEVCIEAASEPGTRVCYLGGPVLVGEPCTDTSACAVGAVCVDPGDGDARCRLACDLRAAVCPSGFECSPLTDPAGYCTEPEAMP